MNYKDKMGSLWIKKGRNGDFMSGNINGVNVVIFKNGNKKNDKHPDYEVYPAQSREELPKKKDEIDDF